MQELILLPEEESIGERADKYLAVQLPQYSRSFFQKLFKDDQIQIQNTPIKASYRITGEEEIALTIPDAQKPYEHESDVYGRFPAHIQYT